MNFPIVPSSLFQAKRRWAPVVASSQDNFISPCIAGLEFDRQVNQDQLTFLQNFGMQQSRLMQAESMLTGLRSKITVAMQNDNHEAANELTVDVDESHQTFLNALIKENGLTDRLVGKKVTINDVIYFTGQVEGWIGAGDMKIDAIQGQSQFTLKQYTAQLKFIDKILTSVYEIFLEVIKKIA